MSRDTQQKTSGSSGGTSRSYGMGFEFAAAVGGFALLGYWIDRHFESSPWGLLICIALGLIGGTYNLIRASLAASRQPPDDGGSGGGAAGGPQDR